MPGSSLARAIEARPGSGIVLWYSVRGGLLAMSAAAETDSSTGSQGSPPCAETGMPGKASIASQVTDALGSLRRLAELQLGIWLIHVKMAITRVVLLIVLGFVSV